MSAQYFFILVLVVGLPHLAEQLLPAGNSHEVSLMVSPSHFKQNVMNINNDPTRHILRTRRQVRNRNQGIFGLLFQLIAETQRDARRAFTEIQQVIDANVIDESQLSTPNSISAALENSENATTTEPPLRVTRQEVLRVLRRNLRALSRLFNQQVDAAVQESNKNAAKARQDFKEAIRPFLAPANITTTTKRP